MKKFFILISFFTTLSLLAYDDSDLDGVDDTTDKCPNTPFMELVDINGCTKKTLLLQQHHYDVIFGMSYSDANYQTLNQTDTLSTTLQTDYYYKNFSLGASTSYYKTKENAHEDKGLNDSYLNASYQFVPKKSFFIRVAAGVILPTYKTDLNNNNIDYFTSVNLSYNVDNISFFGGTSYTIIKDDDIDTDVIIKYQNTLALSAGAGYYLTSKLYASLSYNTSDSIYKTVENIQTVSTYMYYSFNEYFFGTITYAKGTSDSASQNYLSIRMGYYF